MSSLRSGVIRVTYENGEKHMVFVSGGFADVNGSLCTVLAEEAVNLDDLDAEELKAVIGELEANHKENIGMEEEHYIRRQLEIMLAKLDAVKTYKF
jgi:F-type H+-transporting ATPase subunit epsilon